MRKIDDCLFAIYKKFDLTNEQLHAIDRIIALEYSFDQEDFKPILKELTRNINKKIKNASCRVVDIGDVGNEIGIAIGKYIKNEEDKRYLIHGIEHGISLIDGTH